jgi:hypothetical protein
VINDKLLFKNLDKLVYDGLCFALLALSDFVENYSVIRSEYAVGTYITWLVERTCIEVRAIKRYRISITDCLACDLNKN